MVEGHQRGFFWGVCHPPCPRHPPYTHTSPREGGGGGGGEGGGKNTQKKPPWGAPPPPPPRADPDVQMFDRTVEVFGPTPVCDGCAPCVRLQMAASSTSTSTT